MSIKNKESARQVSIFDSLLKKIKPDSSPLSEAFEEQRCFFPSGDVPLASQAARSGHSGHEPVETFHDSARDADYTKNTMVADAVNKAALNKATDLIADKHSRSFDHIIDESADNLSVAQKVRADFFRLAAFAANICEAHSAFIFLPYDALCALLGKASPAIIEERKSLVLVGFQSLSKDSVIHNSRLPNGYGIIGWAARHRKAVHVSPFQLDVRTLGLYTDKQELKSLTARPIALSPKLSSECGVIVCDSKKTYAFSRVHERLLDNLSHEISNTVELLLDRQNSQQPAVMWNNFASKAGEVRQSLGENSIEILRVSIENPSQLEGLVGTQEYTNLAEQLYRLTMQALPAHIPAFRLVNGDLVIFLDSMMSSFYESRLKAICERVTKSKVSFRLVFRRVSTKDKSLQGLSLSELVAASAVAEEKVFDKEKKYGNG